MPKSDTYIQGKGLGLKEKVQPITVRYPADITKILKEMPDTQGFIRRAVIEALEREALIPSELMGTK